MVEVALSKFDASNEVEAWAAGACKKEPCEAGACETEHCAAEAGAAVFDMTPPWKKSDVICLKLAWMNSAFNCHDLKKRQINHGRYYSGIKFSNQV